MNTILVPTDFSETANHALEIAAQLTRKHNSKLVVLHMLEIPLYALPDVEVSNDVQNVQGDTQAGVPEAIFYMKLAEKRFSEIRNQEFLQGIDYEEAVQNHLDFNGIIDSAHKHNADLIVMGSHGATGLREVFVGSNTEKVVRTSDVPVLVVKNQSETFDVKNFVFSSGLDAEDAPSFTKAYKLSQEWNAKLHLVFINTSGRGFLTTKQIDEKFESFLESVDYDAENITTNIYNDDSVEEGILNFSKKVNADLVGIPTHGRKGLAHFIKDSIGEGVANHSEIPVMTFKIK